jgi:hypothetical protein
MEPGQRVQAQELRATLQDAKFQAGESRSRGPNFAECKVPPARPGNNVRPGGEPNPLPNAWRSIEPQVVEHELEGPRIAAADEDARDLVGLDPAEVGERQ